MRTERRTLEMEQIIQAKPAQITVEAEVALPGGLREEAKIYFQDAAADVNAEAVGGRIALDGKITFHALYSQGDMSKVKALEASAPFTQQLQLSSESESSAVKVYPTAEIVSVQAKAFNGRVILRAIVALNAAALYKTGISPVVSLPDTESKESETQRIIVQHTVGQGSREALVREECELPETLQITETLYASAYAQVEDIMGGADGRATVTGNIFAEVYHASNMPKHPLVYTRHTFPFEQQVELTGELGEVVSASALVRDVAAVSQENGEKGRVLRAEILLGVQMQAVRDEEETVLHDVYSTDGDALLLNTSTVRYKTGLVNENTAESAKIAMLLDEHKKPIRTVLATFVKPVLTDAERVHDKLAVDGVAEITIIYLTDDSDAPISVTQEEPFCVNFVTEANADDQLQLMCAQAEAGIVTGDRLDVKCVMHLFANGVRTVAATLVEDVLPTQAPDVRRGINLYYVQPADTLWDIGKRYRMRLDAVRAMNDELKGVDTHDALTQGTAVLIYKKER